MIVDDDGVIVLDSSSDDESDGNDRNARARSNAPQAARKSAPAASAYDSDEHAQYLVREIMSSSDSSSSDDSDAYDDRTAFTSSRAVTGKRKRSHNASLLKRKNEQSRRKPTHKLKPSKRPTVTKATKASKKASRKVSTEDESDSNSSRDDDDVSESESDRAPPLKKAEKKKQTGVKSWPLSTPLAPAFKTKTHDYVTMELDSDDDDDESNAHSDDSEVEHRRKHQRTKSDNAKHLKTQSSSTTTTREQTTARHTRLVTEPPRALPRRTDHAFHQLTEKLSVSELQAQHREFEQISLMHKRAAERSSGGGGGSGQSAPPVARKPPRLESRKSAQPRSRVDEIEQRAKQSAVTRSGRSEAVVTVAPSPREGAIASTPQPPASASGGNNNNNNNHVVRPTTSTTSSSSSSAMAVASAPGGFTGTFRSLDAESTRPPVVHSTAWRRLLPTSAPVNILSDGATHLVPFADEFDRPLPDFDPTGELEKKTQIFVPTAEATMKSDEDMNDRVQQLISEALPVLKSCQERRVKSILRGTREQLRVYLHEHEMRRTELVRSATPHLTSFELTYSERSDLRRLFHHRQLQSSAMNAMVGQVQYFVAHSPCDDASDAAVGGDTDAVDASDATNASSVEQVVYPETVVHLRNDIPPLSKSWAYVGVRKNVHVADDPILRYIPYLGENTRVNFDPKRYSSTTMDQSKRVELSGSLKGSVLELKSVATSALDDELMEYLLRFVVFTCGDSKPVFEALQQSTQFSQPYSDYCEIKKNEDAGRRLRRRVAGMQTLMNDTSDRTECAAEIRQYLRALGASCWFLQPRVERKGLAYRLKPPIPFFESNYQQFSRSGGLRETLVYHDATEWFRDLFCRRCYTYDCDDHGIMQPTPLRRSDPVNPVVRKAGLALRDNPNGVVVDVTAEDADASPNSAAAGGVIELTDSSSDDDANDAAEHEKTPSGSASASDDESSARRRSRRSQTRISTLASASLKSQEKMQEKERRRQRRAEAKQLKELTRTGDDSEYLDDAYMDTVMSVVQSLSSHERTCGADCWKQRKSVTSGDTALLVDAATTTTAEGVEAVTASAVGDAVVGVASAASTVVAEAAATIAEAAATIAKAATDEPATNAEESSDDDEPMPLANGPASVAVTTPPSTHSTRTIPALTDAEVLLIRKLSSTLGDNACLIAAMLQSTSVSCVQVAHFLAVEQTTRLSKPDDTDDASSRQRATSVDLTNRRRQKNERRTENHQSLSGNRELLKRTRAHRHVDKGNKHSYQPCQHAGVCDGCECMKRDHHCNKACSCPRECPNRFQGCKCSLGTCRTKSCPCYSAGRECDPDYCFACGASDAAVLVLGDRVERRLNYDIGICCNANLLRGAQRKVGISFSTTHGWGAFALEPIRKGEFLYEYTGALISDDEAERRGCFYDVMAISFLFDVNCDEVVDATRKGNKSKFANHKALVAANCEAKILLVNGEHRIALYARDDIAVGEELFFDYGYTHETAPKWSQVEIRRGQRFERALADNRDVDDDDDDDVSDSD